jgi:hypothetical protein
MPPTKPVALFFPNVLLGTWAETAQQCAAKDKSNVVIEPAKYGDGDGSCEVALDRSVGGIAREQLRSACPCTSAFVQPTFQIRQVSLQMPE